MSIDALRWAFQQQGLKASQKFVLVALADRADESHECYPSREQLQLDTCLNKETVSSATEELVRLGLIKKARRFNGSTVYRLVGVPERHENAAQSAGKPASRKTGSTVSRKTGSKSAGKPDIDEPENRLLTPNEPPLNREEARARATPPEQPPPFDVLATPGTVNRDAWADWVEHRRRRRKPVSERAAREQWRILSGLSPPQQAACIAHSIRNDYQGLFPEKFTDEPDRPERNPSADRSAAGRVRANVARDRAARAAAAADGNGVAAHELDVRPPMDVEFRRCS